jgi:hypothetical protein
MDHDTDRSRERYDRLSEAMQKLEVAVAKMGVEIGNLKDQVKHQSKIIWAAVFLIIGGFITAVWQVIATLPKKP